MTRHPAAILALILASCTAMPVPAAGQDSPLPNPLPQAGEGAKPSPRPFMGEGGAQRRERDKQAAPVSPMALRLRAELIRTGHAVWGLDAPTATFAAQIQQESSWRPGITAPDDGRGLAQFMDGTAAWLVQRYPALGKADPYNPAWAMRALVTFDRHLFKQVQGADECQRMAAALKGYNAGAGYVLRAQAKSSQPGIWFGVTEHINAGQSAKHFEYSRLYPHKIIRQHQPRFVAAGFGRGVCLP